MFELLNRKSLNWAIGMCFVGLVTACGGGESSEDLAKTTCDCLAKNGEQQIAELDRVTTENRQLKASVQLDRFAQALKKAEEGSIEHCIQQLEANPDWKKLSSDVNKKKVIMVLLEDCTKPLRNQLADKADAFERSITTGLVEPISKADSALERLEQGEKAGKKP